MFAETKTQSIFNDLPEVIQSILHHEAWYGDIEGLKADKLLRGKEHHTYLLRQGERSTDGGWNYYATFVSPDGTVRHQPFVVTITPEGWCAENNGFGGPFQFGGIECMLHRIMHCEKEQLIALSK